jgi:hypothetical protein
MLVFFLVPGLPRRPGRAQRHEAPNAGSDCRIRLPDPNAEF